MTRLSKFTVTATTLVWQLAAISLAGLVLTLLGLGVFGMAPALVACLWATARLEDHTAQDLMRGMWGQFRAEFLRTNLVVGPMMLGVALLGVMAIYGPAVLMPVWLACAVLMLAQIIAALVVLATLSGSVSDAWSNAFLAMTMVPYRLLASVLSIPVILLVTLWQPMVGVYFALAIWALFTNLVVRPGLASVIPNEATSQTGDAS